MIPEDRVISDSNAPTADEREFLLARRTEPDKEIALLLKQLSCARHKQSPPEISAPSSTVQCRLS